MGQALILISVIAAAGLSRALVGAGLIDRGIAYPVAAMLVVITGALLGEPFIVTHSGMILTFAVAGAITLTEDLQDWNKRALTAKHFGAWPLLVSFCYATTYGSHLSILVPIWCVSALILGAIYGDLMRLLEHLMPHPRKVGSVTIDATRIVEFTAGCIILGLVSVL